MFEKEAEEYAEAFVNRGVAEASFQKGAEFGYNKANERIRVSAKMKSARERNLCETTEELMAKYAKEKEQ